MYRNMDMAVVNLRGDGDGAASTIGDTTSNMPNEAGRNSTMDNVGVTHESHSNSNNATMLTVAGICTCMYIWAVRIVLKAFISFGTEPTLWTLKVTTVSYGMALSLSMSGMCMWIYVGMNLRTVTAMSRRSGATSSIRFMRDHFVGKHTNWNNIGSEVGLTAILACISMYGGYIWNILRSTTSFTIPISQSCIVWIVIMYPVIIFVIPMCNAICYIVMKATLCMITYEITWFYMIRKKSLLDDRSGDISYDHATKRRSENQCCICHDALDYLPLRFTSTVETIRCAHRFHSTCLRQWTQKTLSCPICRADLL
jgi:hypothetical protein